MNARIDWDLFNSPPASINVRGIYNDGRFERESARIEVAKLVAQIALTLALMPVTQQERRAA